MKTPVHRLLAKLHSLDPAFKALNRRKIRASADKCVDDFVIYLRWLQGRHCKKQNTRDYHVSVVFQQPRRFGADVEIAAYCRTHLTVAVAQIEKLLATMRKGKDTISTKTFKQYAPLLYDYLHDLRMIAEYLERRKNPNYEFFRGTKSYQAMGWQLFRASRQLAQISVDGAVNLDHNVSHIAAVFMLRQAMEVKFERIVGISFSDKSLQTPKLRHGFHYEFIRSNLNYFEFSSVDFTQLQKIYNWCSVLLHRAIQPLAWQLPFAFEVTAGLFDSGSDKQSGRWSIHGGVMLRNKESMQTAFAEHFCSTYEHGIWCINSGATEAMEHDA